MPAGFVPEIFLSSFIVKETPFTLHCVLLIASISRYHLSPVSDFLFDDNHVRCESTFCLTLLRANIAIAVDFTLQEAESVLPKQSPFFLSSRDCMHLD